MNDIRKNKEEEKTLIRARFKVPTIIKVFIIWFFIQLVLCLVLGFVLVLVGRDDSSALFLITLGIIGLIVAIFHVIWFSAIKHCRCEITNKRIKGVTTNFIVKKTYSYRLDEIDNVEVISSLGIPALNLNFSQGHGPQNQQIAYHRGTRGLSAPNTFRLLYIANANELYEKLSELLTSLKNHEDVMVDIEMEKVNAAIKQAEAIEKLVAGSANSSQTTPTSGAYIEELKQLKELLDNGIITQEEFDSKKADLLAKK